MQVGLAVAVSALPPDLVSFPPVGAGEEVAHRQVLDADAAGLEGFDAVPPRLRALDPGPARLPLGVGRTRLRGTGDGAVHDHLVSVHAPKVDAGRGDEDAGLLGLGRAI